MALLHIPVAELYASLNLLKNFTATRDIVPLLRCVLFNGSTMRTYDGKAGCIAYTSWAVKEPFTLPGERFLRLVESLWQQQVEKITLDVRRSATGGFVTVQGGTATARFRTDHAPIEFPLREPPKGLRARVPLSDTFWESLERVEFCITKDETKERLRGVYWDKLRMVAADSHRLARRACAFDPPKGHDSLVLPSYLLSRIAAHRASVAEIGIDGNLCWIFMESAAVYGPLIADEYPHSVVDERFATMRATFVAQKDKVTWCDLTRDEAAFARLDLFIDEFMPKVYVDVHDSTVTITASTDDAIEERFAARTSGPRATFCVNLHYLRDALARAERFGYLPAADTPSLYFLSTDRSNPFEHLVVLYRDERTDAPSDQSA